MLNLIRRENREANNPRIQESWDPFRMMDALLRWEPFWGTTHGLPHRGEAFIPRFDVNETKDGYRIRADVPGVKEGDVNISLTGNVLNIAGHRTEEHREEGEQFYAAERCYGEFTRSFALPEGADVERIHADLKEGVLAIDLPKKPEVQSRRISLGKTKPADGGTKS